MKRFRFAAVMASTLALTACAYGEGGTGVFMADCSRAAVEKTAGIDWEKANTVNLRIRQGDFSPGYIGLIQGKAYVLRVENGDDDDRYFRAIDFFRSVAVEQISVIGGRTFKTPCVDALTLQAGRTTEVRLVAVRDGSYEFQNNSLLMSMALIGSTGGFITIERERFLPKSPVETLKLRNALAIEPVSTRPGRGLFDDQEEETLSPGLFDDQVEETPTPGLFDDQVEETPTPGLFDDPTEPAPAASLAPELRKLPEGMFGEPAPDAIDLPQPQQVPEPDSESALAPEQPIEASPSVPVIRDGGPELDDSVNGTPGEETTTMTEPAPESAPQPVPAEAKTTAQPAEPAYIPEPPQGPPANIYSDEPDAVGKPGSGGGDDTFSSIG
ncbi:MAG: hypothetical protein ACTSV1_07345 [Alphaproteobacteria bacterium]